MKENYPGKWLDDVMWVMGWTLILSASGVGLYIIVALVQCMLC